ncbi:phBC6A51 family helix-turn-helix protein [Bacillus mycoides]|uniref:Phage protein n=1 Tax=Bacillus mycoides (strain KBAB4) TaxID=315730 RepID=A9VVM3_BACMK|nr:phBC6A51 family helix-turn-helix protein [Bacillus mycoides]ABY46838.1 phage protein [Bacillus mycoides KBAB4]
MASKKELESRLNLKQREAALLLVENELNIEGERKTQEEIAQELGVTRMCLYKWRTQNKSFIDYKNMIADEFLSEKRDFVYRQLLRTISGSQPSIKGIDLFLRRHGLLTDKKVIEDNTADGVKSNSDLEKEIAEINALLKK